MPGVAVKATHEATNAVTAAVTDSAGLYVLRGLLVGRYAVTAELAGFQTFQTPDIVVRVNDEVRLDVALRVGAITETVTVNGLAAPSTPTPARCGPSSISSASRTCR